MPPNTQLLLLALTHWLWLSTRMYNLKKHFIFFGEKNWKNFLGLSRLLYLDYDYFRNLIIRLRLLQKSDFARILDYDYFRNLISLDSSITITSENYVALDYSITITSKKSSQPIWPSLTRVSAPIFQFASWALRFWGIV